MRSCVFSLPYSVPYMMIGKLVAAAVQWTNQDCTLANKNSVPPEVMIHDGKLLDFRHRGIAHFGELVLAPLAHQGPGYKSIDSPRRIMCIYMHPVHHGGHKLLVMDSVEKPTLQYINRKLKPGMIHPYIPMSLVGRLNARASKERMKYTSGEPSEVIRQYDLDTGYDENSEINAVESEFIIRSPQTLGMKPNEIATQTDESDDGVAYEVNNNEDIELPEELLDRQEETINAAILMNIDERIDYVPPCYSGGDLHSSFDEKVSESISPCNENDAEWCFGLKKELNLHKAMKQYGRQSSMKSMGQELLGIVKRNVWKPILKKLLTKSQRKKSSAMSRITEVENEAR